MPKISLQKSDIPFLFGGAGNLSVDSANLQLNQPLDPFAPSIFKVAFDTGGSQSIALGGEKSVKLGVKSSTAVELFPIFPTTTGTAVDLLRESGLGSFFGNGAHGDKVVIGCTIGASVAASASGSFNYSALKAGFELEAGADGSFYYLRALDKTLPIELLLSKFFSTMRLPEQFNGALEAGEAISLKYGGYLKLAAEVSAGYQLAGTKSIGLGDMALSEKYNLSIIGKVGLTAGIAGQFSIVITGVEELAGWARVRVHRQKSNSFGIAADVQVGFKNELENLPSTANEFLGAVLGVNSKNFLNVFEKARDLADFQKFKASIDGLAQRYVAEFVGKGFDQLSQSAEFTSFLSRVNQVEASYQTVGDRAVSLFDRYFSQQNDLIGFLNKIKTLNAQGLDTLRQDLNPMVWNMLSQLTDGDPLSFLLSQVTVGGKKIDSLVELQKRANSVLELMTSGAHAEIRKLIEQTKQRYDIDKLMAEMAKIDTVDELKTLANEKVGQFVSRLVGRTLDSSANIKEAFKEIKAVLDNAEGFKNKLYGSFKDALNSSYSVALHASYSRSSESDGLIDVLINVAGAKGQDLLSQAGKGDFEEILATADTALVRLREGVFTHRLRRESAFKVHIVGWHLNYAYEGFDRVITETEQRLVPSDRGITVFTTANLQVEKMRKRQNEQMHVNFLLRALGESAKAVQSDGKTLAYLIESLNTLTARYELSFTDEDTSALELQDYLAFAKDLGLDKQGATLDTLTALLPSSGNGGFGRVDTSYDVRFGEKALAALLRVKQLQPQTEALIRNAMRQMVLANYLKSDEMHDVAFSYATDGVFKVFDSEGFAEFTNHSNRSFAIRLSNPAIAAPAVVSLDKMELNVLSTLYNIENEMVSAIRDLTKLLSAGIPMDPRDFEKKLGKFGNALKDFDKFDQTSNKHGVGTNTIFSMFDLLVRFASPGESSNVSVLRLKSTANGRDVEKMFLSDEAAEIQPAFGLAAAAPIPGN